MLYYHGVLLKTSFMIIFGIFDIFRISGCFALYSKWYEARLGLCILYFSIGQEIFKNC